MSEPILVVEDLVKTFEIRSLSGFHIEKRSVQAVTGVSFTLDAGQTMGLVGESGSGKTTVGRCVLRLVEPTAGSIKFEGVELMDLDRNAMRKIRREMQIVFQDPYASLDPRRTVGAAIAEPFEIQKISGDHDKRVGELLELVGLAADHAQRFPHEFSGGQRQRIGIARALALNPKLVILDEPVSALDVSIQAGVVNLLQDLQDELGLSYIFIAHDLSIVRHISDVIAVMYLGKLVEVAPADRDLRAAVASVHAGVAVGGAGARSAHRARASSRRVGGRGAVADQSAERMPVPHALPEGGGQVRGGGTAADRTRDGPSGGLPLPGDDLRRPGCAGELPAVRTVGFPAVRDVMLYLTLAINVLAMAALIAGILMHSGRGGGLSDMFGGGGGAALGSSAAERNLNRITFVFALIWIFTLVALDFLLDVV